MFKRKSNSFLAFLVYLFTIGVSAGCIPVCESVNTASIESVQRVSDSQDKTHSDVDYGIMNYQQAIEAVNTPEEVLDYYEKHLRQDNGKDGDQINSFKTIHETGKGLCGDYAVAAAALLSDDGYKPVIVYLWKEGTDRRHAIYIYKENGKFGSIGMNEDDRREPIYDNADEIIHQYFKHPLSDIFILYDSYLIVDLDGTTLDWITTGRPLNFIYLKKDAKRIEGN